MVDWARARREAIRKQAELRRRLTAAEQALDNAQAQVQQAEAAFDAASDRFAAAENALDEARAERARSREERYQARQGCERASTAVERLRRRVAELGDRLDRMPPLTLVALAAGRTARLPLAVRAGSAACAAPVTSDVSDAGIVPLCVESPPYTGRGRLTKGTQPWAACVP